MIWGSHCDYQNTDFLLIFLVDLDFLFLRGFSISLKTKYFPFHSLIICISKFIMKLEPGKTAW